MSLPIAPKRFNVLVTPGSIYIDNDEKKKIIAIDRSYYSISPVTNESVLSNAITQTTKCHEIDSVLGLITISDAKYLLIVWKSEQVAFYQNYPIYKIREVDLIQLSITEPRNPSVFDLMRNNLKHLLQNGNFYYSVGFDLTRSQQEKTMIFTNNQGKVPLHNIRFCNRNYMINYQLLSNFFKFETDEDFISSLIYGYVGMVKSVPFVGESNAKADFLVIERYIKESIDFTGNSLGLSEKGWHCFNYKEIETICIVDKDNIFSYLILESTAPVDYSDLGKGDNMDQSDTNYLYVKFANFAKQIIDKYSSICIISFLGGNDGNRLKISNRMESIYNCNPKHQDRIKYINYEKLQNFEHFVKISKNVIDYIGLFGVFKNMLSPNYSSIKQNGVFWLVNYNNVPNDNSLSHRLIEELNWLIAQKEFDLLLMNLDLGKYEKSNQSPIYLKYSSLFSSFLSAKYNFANINKDANQSQMNQLTSQYIIDDNLKKRKSTIIQPVTILLTTWNAGGISPIPEQTIYKNSFDNVAFDEYNNSILQNPIKNHYDLSPLFTSNKLYREQKIGPDLLIVGMQEIVKLKATNIILHQNTKRVESWKGAVYLGIRQAFPNEEYDLLKEMDLVGIMLLVYKKKTINAEIIDHLTIKSGVMGTMGNKGNCIVSMKIYNTSIAISTGHFTAGQKKCDERLKMLEEVLASKLKYYTNEEIIQMNYQDKLISKKYFQNFDLWFIFGDINFRIDQSYNEVVEKLAKGQLEDLRRYDQFLNIREMNGKYKTICEGMINFYPTYKYEKMSDNFAKSGNKIRIPSWCDRIFFKATPDIKILEYTTINMKYSDHRPVFGLYEVSCAQNLFNEKDIIVEEMKSVKENMDFNFVNISNVTNLLNI